MPSALTVGQKHAHTRARTHTYTYTETKMDFKGRALWAVSYRMNFVNGRRWLSQVPFCVSLVGDSVVFSCSRLCFPERPALISTSSWTLFTATWLLTPLHPEMELVISPPLKKNVIILLKYSWFTMLCYFLLYSKVIQLCLCIHSFSYSLLLWFITGY